MGGRGRLGTFKPRAPTADHRAAPSQTPPPPGRALLARNREKLPPLPIILRRPRRARHQCRIASGRVYVRARSPACRRRRRRRRRRCRPRREHLCRVATLYDIYWLRSRPPTTCPFYKRVVNHYNYTNTHPTHTHTHTPTYTYNISVVTHAYTCI
ncbi:unnamed protein product [Aphis gossypii]|uniref:Uncharacterized protein n=1 Tax=Aphis gossypii TaxID=80765 RepID=A0A9P0NGG5_APHGO|nr:unnamed protein product [Aphis gossypii]